MVAGEHLVRGCGAGGRAEGAARTYEAVLYSTRGSRFVRLLAGQGNCYCTKISLSLI
eukprot:COSAG06_NODE_9578_length_1866_cov_1.240521_2_plen_57_part_00